MMLVLTYCWVSHLNPTYLALSEMQGWKRGFRAMAIGGIPAAGFCAGTAHAAKQRGQKNPPGKPGDFVQLEYIEMVL
jgi:hypothetical protein